MRLQPLGHLSGENLLRNELALRRLFHPPKRLKVPVETLFRHWIELSLDSMGESCQPQLVRARQKTLCDWEEAQKHVRGRGSEKHSAFKNQDQE